MIRGQRSGARGPICRVRRAHRLRYVGLLALSLVLLSPLSCYQREPQALLPSVPSAVVTPADPWAAYRSLLVGDTLEKQREIFRLGYRFLQEKNRDGARVFFARALEVYPLLADYSLYYLGLLSREAGQPTEARASFLRLLADHPESIWAGHAALEVATLALAEGNWAEAVQYAQQARASRVALEPVRHEAALVLAQAREGQGDKVEAYSLYQELRRTTPRSAVGKTAKARVEQLRALEPERFALRDDQEYLDEVRLLAQEDDGGKAEEFVQQFTSKFPASPLRPEVLTVLAAVYKGRGRAEDA